MFLFETVYAHDVHPEKGQQIAFIENKNQWDSHVLFRLEYQNSTLFFEKDGITQNVISPESLQQVYDHKFSTPNNQTETNGILNNHAYKVTFLNSSKEVKIEGKDIHNYYFNYYLGNDSKKWASEVPLFKSLIYNNIYNGIDLIYYEESGLLKYEYQIQPGIDPGQIISEYTGDVDLKIKDGMLIVQTSVGDVKELKPFAYQIDKNDEKIVVECSYSIKKNRVSYKLGHYNPTLPLIIDPSLIFSTYSGSSADNWGFTATYDLNGNMYGGGIAFAAGYPITTGAYQTNFSNYIDITISKFNSIGSNLIYSTYLGGTGGELPHSLIVNENNELYVFGTTSSANFPTSATAYQTLFKGGPNITCSNSISYFSGSDIIISKFNQSGTQLLASTFMGGTQNDGLNLATPLRKNYADEVRGEIILDQFSNVYITTSTTSSNFPVTVGAYSTTLLGTQGAVVFKLNHNLSNLIWSTYLSGTGNSVTAGYSISAGANNSVYITGGTNATNLPASTNAYQTNNHGGLAEGYVAHIDQNGAFLMDLTYFGSSVYDQSYLVKTDRFFQPYIVGQTSAPQNSFVNNAIWHYGMGQFIAKFTPELDSVIWSTEFGDLTDGPDISPTALLVDVCNRVYLSGWGGNLVNSFGGTEGLPITSDAYQNTTDDNDYYLMCISDDASYLTYGSYFGSPYPNNREHVDGGTSRFDRQGRVYQAVCAGCGGSSSFPHTSGAYSETNNSNNCNLAVFKIDFDLPAVVSEFNMPNTVCAPATVSFNNQSLIIGANTSFFWDFGDGTTSSDFMPNHTFTQSGIYNITLVVHDLGSCNFADTLVKQLMVLSNSTQVLPSITVCSGDVLQIGVPPAPQDEVTYYWTPSTGLSNPNVSNPIATITDSITYTLLATNAACTDTIIQTIDIIDIDLNLNSTYTICEGDTLLINPAVLSNVTAQYFWSTSPTFSNIINSDFSSPNLVLYPVSSGQTLYLKAFKGDCEIVASTNVVISTISIVAPESLTVCFNNPIQLNLQVSPSNCTYEWSPMEYIVSGGNTATPLINPSVNTTLFVTVTNSNNCKESVSIPIVVQNGTFPTIFNAWCTNAHIYLGESTLLESTLYTDNEYTYSWTPVNHLATPHENSTMASPVETTLYTVKVTDYFGCYKSDTVTVFVTERICDEPYVYIPNAFTPNGDGNNDVLYVRSEIMNQFVFRVYNRLGELMFETRDLSNGWDGKYKGEKCTPGVYDYYLEGRCLNMEPILKKGNITLIR